MARMGVFRFVRGIGASPALRAPLAACVIAAGAGIFGVSGCGDVEIVQAGIPPAVIGIEPATGPSEGGTPVVITGQNFEKGATVRFGGELAESVKWVDAKTISAITPAGAGVVAVSVENPSRLVDTKEDAFTFEGEGSGCAVLSTLPEVGADEVPVVGELRLVYGAPIDVASLEGAVKLTLISTGEEVPVDVTLGAETDTDVIVRPKQSLRFWGSYAISIGDGVLATDGSACAPAALAFATVKPKAAPRALRPALVSGLAITGGFAIVASEGYKGLQTYDVANPASASLKSDLVTKFGPRGIVIHGDRGYAPSGALGVQIFDVTDPTAPVLLGHAGTPGRANDVAILDANGKTYLVIADSAEGLRVVEATDPQLPVDLGTIALGAEKPSIGAIDLQGDTIAATDGTRVRLVQLPDPATPATAKVLGSFDVGVAIGDVTLSNDRVFVSKQAFGVASYDVTNPADAALIDSEDDPDGPCPDGCLDSASTVVKDGGDLFVAFGRGGVQKFTIDAAGALTPSTIYKGASNARTVAVAGSSVYVGADEGLYIFDRNGNGQSPSWVDQSGHGIARTASVSGDFLYVGDWLRGVQTFSLADPEAPALVDRDDTPGALTSDVGGYGTAASGGVLAVGDGRAGVTLLDLADPANPVLGGTIDTVDALTTVAKVGTVTFGCDGNQGIVAIDSSDPKSPKLLSEAVFDPPGNASPDLAPAGDVIYVASRFGLGVLDVKDPSALAWKGMIEMPQKAAVTSVRAVGSHVVVTTNLFDYEGANNNNVTRLHVLDATDPLAPKLVWSSEDLGGAQYLTVVGDIAFVAAGGPSVKIFDLADIEHPVLEGSVETPANVSFTAVGNNVLYAVLGAGGIQAIHTGPLPATK